MSKTLRRTLLLGACALGATASLASCGTQSDDNTLVIGLECNYAPFNWTIGTSSDYTLSISNQANSYADGYDIVFAKRAAKELNMNVKIVKLEWDNLIPQLNAGTINCIIAGMTDTAERRESIDFTNEYYRSELVLVTSKKVADQYNSTTLNLSDLQTLLNGKGLISQIQTVTDSVIDSLASSTSCVHMTPVDTFAIAATQVSSGAAFAMTSELPVAQSIVNANSSLGIIRIDQSVLGVDLSELGVSIGIKKGNTDLQSKLNSVLANYSQEERNADMSAAVERSANI